MIPVWNDKYSIGSPKIDEQHKKLFDLAGKAFVYANKNISKEQMKVILAEFFDYMKYHFDDEEKYMKQIGYPLLEKHSKIHKSIVADMTNLITKIGNLNDLKEGLLVVAKNWLLEHILQNDMLIEKWHENYKLRQINPEIPEIDLEKFSKSATNKVAKPHEANSHEAQKPQNQDLPKTFKYICGCPNKIHNINQTIHEKIKNGSTFKCKTCNQNITFLDK